MNTAYLFSFTYQIPWFLNEFSKIIDDLEVRKEDLRVVYVGTALESNIANDLFSLMISLEIDCTNITDDLLNSEQIIKDSDILLIQGGNTEDLLEIWSKGFKQILEKLRRNKELPTILGISAGGFWLFTDGISDSVPDQWTKLEGYDWIHDHVLFHADNTEVRNGLTRRQYFDWMFKSGLTLDSEVIKKITFE